MKKLTEICCLFLLPVLLCSCPYSSVFYLDDTSRIPVDDALLGKWVCNKKKPHGGREETIFLTLSRRSATTYYISLTGNLEELRPYRVLIADTLAGITFMSNVDNRLFFNISLNNRVYIAEAVFKNNTFSLLPLADGFTAKMIFNSTDLRKSIELHYKTRALPLFDDDFCLRDMKRAD